MQVASGLSEISTILGHLETEVVTAARSYYLWKNIHNIAANNERIYRGLNEQALSWITILHSLQITSLIALGRLFDSDDRAFSADTVLRKCIENIDQFGRDALRERKRQSGTGLCAEQLTKYIKKADVPEEVDFRKLRGELSKRQKHYREIYRPIRNKILAHKDSSMLDTKDTLFEGTKLKDIEEFLWFFHQLQCIIWELLHNGRKTKIGDHSFREEEYITTDVQALLDRLRV